VDDSGASQSIGNILMVFLVVLFAGVTFVYVMSIEEGSAIGDYTPQYAMMDATVIPALSALNTWDADSIKIRFTAGNELDLQYEEGVYAGTEGIKFMLIDPDGGSHEAMQSITMQGQRINPGAEFYYFTVSSGLPYYITNAYSRIGDDSTWGGDWSYPKPFASGTWRVQIIDDNLGVLIADEEVVI
jgi:hypothetical protein